MKKLAMSSGHGKLVRGASGYLDEVEEARKIVDKTASLLRDAGAQINTFHDDTSTSQNQNLNTIVDWHNRQDRELDISIHLNAYEDTGAPMGTECLYVSQATLAETVAAKIAHVSGLKNRGPKKRTDLFFLNKTTAPAILIEVCFVDSTADAGLYNAHFQAICSAIAEAASGKTIGETPQPPPEQSEEFLFRVKGKASSFGGPNDTGVSHDEGLAFIFSVESAPHLFLATQPPNTTGLARRLNPHVHYVACRWDYAKTPKEMLRQGVALVCAPDTGMAMYAFPADWGPNESTTRVADLSPSLMEDLGLETDGIVEVFFPFHEQGIVMSICPIRT